ncbi:MAG: restriction endonuclease [bacterium]
MTPQARTNLELMEYEPRFFPSEMIPEHVGKLIWQNHSSKVDINFPSPVTDNQWKLTAQGRVGLIPINDEFSITIQPKVQLSKLFRMLEYAYTLNWLGHGLRDLKSLKDFYERIAHILALRFLDRTIKGLYRSYVDECQVLPYVRGRLDMDRLIKMPWEAEPKCHYQKHTADIEDNQLIAWTLFVIARSGLCSDRVLPTIRKAYRSTHGLISLKQFHPSDCLGRLYHRLNEDYQALHALCRFFLEHTGPTHESGDRTMLSFLINMNSLFELFVAQWLKKNLPHRYSIRAQERVYIGEERDLYFDIDLVLYDNISDQTLCVLETKYKDHDKPSMDDISQVVAYAESRDCNEAILIYPIQLTSPVDVKVGKIRVRTLGYPLNEDLEEMGNKLKAEILS